VAEDTSSGKTLTKKIRVPHALWGLLRELSTTQLFGDGPAGTAVFLLKREMTRMATTGELDALLARIKRLEAGSVTEEADDETDRG
jgi:hypothetical protein